MRRFATLLLLAVLVGIYASAIPAHRGMVQMPQPDGTLVTISLVGDEFYHFNTTADGYSVILNDKGAYVYAQRDGKTLKETDVLAHDQGQRTGDELALLATLPKRLVDENNLSQGHLRRAKRNVDLSDFDFSTFRGLVILIDFSDMKFSAEDPKAFYTEMFSTEDFTNYVDPFTERSVTCPGSVLDYFKDQSNGAFTPHFDVYGPYTSTRTATSCNRYSTSIFTTALKAANNDVDFTKYDNNNDGKVDMIYFLVAGYSSSYSGNNSGYLWPHASTLSYQLINYDGKRMDRYASSTELYGWENSSQACVEAIGTICHEFSHVLGLPDFYDTNYDSDGQSHDPGAWDLMAGGADHNYGRTPAGYTFFERYALGWANPVTINSEGTYSLRAVNLSHKGYILRTPAEKEFFTIENRQQTGWDSYIPGHGMIVTRVDSSDVNVWSMNLVNVDPYRNYFEMLRAGNTTSGDLSSDPFPGTKGNPMLTNETLPSLKTWDGQKNQYIISGISEKDGVISFNVLLDGTLKMLVEDFENMTPNSSTSDTNVEGSFATWSFNKAGVRAPGSEKADGENSVMMKLPSQFFTTTPLYYNFYLASLDVFNSGSYIAKYSLEYSLDEGATWTKATSSSGGDGSEIASKTNARAYWTLNLTNRKPTLFRISQVGGNKNAATYVDNFTLYYEGEVGPGIKPGDVNNDGEVNIADINAVIDMILSANFSIYGDVNDDGEVNIADVNTIIDMIIN